MEAINCEVRGNIIAVSATLRTPHMHCLHLSIIRSDDLPRYCCKSRHLHNNPPAQLSVRLSASHVIHVRTEEETVFVPRTVTPVLQCLSRPLKRRPTWQLRWNLELGSTGQFDEAFFVTHFSGHHWPRDTETRAHPNIRSSAPARDNPCWNSCHLPSALLTTHHSKSCLATWFLHSVLYKNHLYC